MAGEDNILNLFIRANIDSLKAEMAEAPNVVRAAVDSMKTAAASLPAAVEASTAQAAAAFVALNPQIQSQSVAVLDLQVSYDKARAALKETNDVLLEAGGSANAEKDILKVLAQETVEVEVKQLALKQATKDLDAAIRSLISAQLESGAAAKAQAAGMDTAASSAAGAATSFDATATAALAFADGVVASSIGLDAAATRVIALRGALAEVTTALKETDAALLEMNEAEAEASGLIEQQTRLLVAQKGIENELKVATQERSAVINEGYAAQIKKNEASATESAATERNTTATNANSQANRFNTISEEGRARAMAEIARLEAEDAAATTSSSSATVESSRSAAVATTQTATAATTASAAYLRLAAATIANSQAQAQVRSIASGAAEATGLEAQFTNELALAQERAAATAAELAAAERALTQATLQASDAQSNFRGRIALSEYGMRGFISGMVTSVPALIALFAAGFAVRAVEAIKQTELELGNLSRATDVSVRDLYSLSKVVEESGGKSEELATVFRRLGKTISDAASGNESARLTLRELGVDMTEISQGIVPQFSTVLAQVEDHLMVTRGNAELVRASMRALGTDNIQVIDALSRGAQGLREESEKFKEAGTEMALNTGEARKLQQSQTELGVAFDRLKLNLLPLINDWIELAKWMAQVQGVTGILNTSLQLIGATTRALHGDFSGLADISGWTTIKNAVDAAATSQNIYAQALGLTLERLLGIKAIEGGGIGPPPRPTPPLPPELAEKKTEKEKAPRAVPSDLPQFREELAQQEALFEGSRAEMLAMELAFWERLISTGRVKSRDLIAVQREIAVAEINLRRESVREAEAESRELVSLTRSGSQDRITETQRNMELERRLHKEGSVEFAAAQKEYLLAVRDRVEETIRLQIQSVEENVSLESRGSSQRTALYNSELTTLQRALATAQSEVTREQTEWTTTGNVQARQRMIIAQGEADFIINEIVRVTKERNTAAREEEAELEKQRADAERLRVTEAVGGAREKIGEIDVSARKEIQQIEQNSLLTFRQKDEAIRQIIAIQRTQLDNALAGAEAEAAANLALAKTTEQRIAAEKLLDQVQRLRAAAVKRALSEELDEDNRVAKQMEKNATDTANIISSSFKSAFDKMLTTHTNFATVMTNFWNEMVKGFAEMGLQILANWIKHLAAMVIETIIETNVMKAIMAAFGAAPSGPNKTAADTSAAEAKISANTGQAASDVFLQAIEKVPFPENLVAAPAASALVIAEMSGFAGLAAAGGAAGAVGAAEQGALLTRDTLVQAHAGEMIVPAAQTKQLTGSFPAMSLPASISAGLSSLSDAAKIGTGVLSAGAGVAASASTSASNSTSTTNHIDARTIHVRPSITVNQHGDSSGRMSTEDITRAVHIGIRKGLLTV